MLEQYGFSYHDSPCEVAQLLSLSLSLGVGIWILAFSEVSADRIVLVDLHLYLEISLDYRKRITGILKPLDCQTFDTNRVTNSRFITEWELTKVKRHRQRGRGDDYR
jgi:hypothetical protein